MTAKEYLKQYEEMNKRALRYKNEYDIELEMIDAVASSLSDPDTPRRPGTSRATENKAVRLSEKAAAWKMAELDAIEKRQEIFDLISKINGIEGEVLYQRYIMLNTWENICEIVNYSWNGTNKAHRRGLAIVQSLMDGNNSAL